MYHDGKKDARGAGQEKSTCVAARQAAGRNDDKPD
jgi:hypothetical protein